MYKAPKGLLRIEANLEFGIISKVKITGDFFMVPEDALPKLERYLDGVRLEYDAVLNAVEKFYSSGAQTPMLGKEDIVKAVLGVVSGG